VLALALSSAPASVAARPGTDPTAAALSKLEGAVSPRRSAVRRAAVTLGHSSAGRPITATARNGVPTSWSPHPGGPLVLVFGCIHGDECAGAAAAKRSLAGECPPPGDGLVVVPNLNPDGLALGTRLNARGVDLNRNFATDWLPGGSPGDLEYPGPRPFSEPESRLARRLIRTLRPDVTIWFHQQDEPLVRAWGDSIPAARIYARLAGLPFVAMPWLAGTAPNWQNHRFPGTSSFVVELPDDGPVHVAHNAAAIFALAGALMRGRDG
jgi:murein peptide amidase A